MEIYQYKNRIVNLDLVRWAAFESESPAKLRLIFAPGKELEMDGEEAKAFWHALCKSARQAGR